MLISIMQLRKIPQKAGELNIAVMKVKSRSDSLYNYVAQLKEMIVKKADGPEGDVNNIESKDDLNIPAELMIVKKTWYRSEKGN